MAGADILQDMMEKGGIVVNILKTLLLVVSVTLMFCAEVEGFSPGDTYGRTPGSRKGSTVFETAPFDHSGTPPGRNGSLVLRNKIEYINKL